MRPPNRPAIPACGVGTFALGAILFLAAVPFAIAAALAGLLCGGEASPGDPPTGDGAGARETWP